MAGPNPAPNWTPRGATPLAVVVLASGTGTNLQAILDRFKGSRHVRVVGVASNNPKAKALDRARLEEVPVATFARDAYSDRQSRDRQMAAWIRDLGAQLIVSAGYLEILSPEFVDQFRDRIINIHPSILPQFPGLNSIERAYLAHVKRSGVTIHFVDEGVDTGPVIRQKNVWRYPGESLHRFEARIHAREHKLLPRVIWEVALGKIKIGVSQPDGLVRETIGERSMRYLNQFAVMRQRLSDALASSRSRSHPHSTAGAGHR